MSAAFYILSTIIVLSGFGVIAFRNPIQSALCLIVNLLAVAGIFALLEAHFLAVVQIIVYAGAIMVLVVFVIMLLSTKAETWSRSDFFPILFSLLAAGVTVWIVGWGIHEQFNTPLKYDPLQVGTIERIGRVLFSKYVFAFEASSLLLMAAIVGAVMVAKTNYGAPKIKEDLEDKGKA